MQSITLNLNCVAMNQITGSIEIVIYLTALAVIIVLILFSLCMQYAKKKWGPYFRPIERAKWYLLKFKSKLNIIIERYRKRR